MYNIIDNVIYLSRGDSCNIAINIMEDDEPYTIKSGEILLFSLKKVTDQCKTILTKEFIKDGNDYVITFDESDTVNLAFGTYTYDVILISGDEVYTIIEPTEFNILEVVHNEISR